MEREDTAFIGLSVSDFACTIYYFCNTKFLINAWDMKCDGMANECSNSATTRNI